MTAKALQIAGIEPQNFQLSMKKFMEDPEVRKKIQENDANTRLAIEGKEIKETKETAIAALKFKMNRDMSMFRKLNSIRFTTS